MNKQSNTYTVIYVTVLVAIVGAALALTAMCLKPLQQANADADKMRQILSSAHISSSADNVINIYRQHITATPVVNSLGETVGDDAFEINVEEQSKLPYDERKLPVYVCRVNDDQLKYIIPLYGAGLWGPIWGYVAFDADGSTIYGAYFAHQGETPGLGAEIEKPAFTSQFDGKQVFKNNVFHPVAVIKAGMAAPDGVDAVDGVSGGTITSKGVGQMLSNCLAPYEAYLKTLADNDNSH